MEKDTTDSKRGLSFRIYEHALLLADWNEKHIDDEPEQVRKNIETLASIYPH